MYLKKVRFKSSFKRSKALNVDLRKTVPQFRSRLLKCWVTIAGRHRVGWYQLHMKKGVKSH